MEQWRHISSKLNPADAASCGIKADVFLSAQEWINGPQFLSKPHAPWPGNDSVLKVEGVPDDDPEVKGEIHVFAAVLDTKECPTSQVLSY